MKRSLHWRTKFEWQLKNTQKTIPTKRDSTFLQRFVLGSLPWNGKLVLDDKSTLNHLTRILNSKLVNYKSSCIAERNFFLLYLPKQFTLDPQSISSPLNTTLYHFVDEAKPGQRKIVKQPEFSDRLPTTFHPHTYRIRSLTHLRNPSITLITVSPNSSTRGVKPIRCTLYNQPHLHQLPTCKPLATIS